MSRCVAAVVVSVAGVGAFAGSALGQVSFGPSFVYSQITAPAQFASPPNGGFVTTDTANGVKLTGDATLVTPYAEQSYSSSWSAFRKFSVGQFPVGVTLSASWEFKFISANFGAAFGSGELTTVVMLTSSVGGLPLLPPIVNEQVDSVVDHGGKAEIRSSTFSYPEVLLPAYSDWYIGVGLAFNARVFDTTAGRPHRRYTFEAGGLTPYEGLSVSIEWRALPSPGAAGVLGLGGVVMGWRRRR